MSGGKSLLCLLQRCVSVRLLTAPAATRTTRTLRTVPSISCGFTQQRLLTSSSASVRLRELCQLRPAARSSQHRFCTKTETPCEDEYPPLPAYKLSSEPGTKDVYIVQVKGIPWSCTTEDLLLFFSECRIPNGEQGVHMTLDRIGRPSGQAFIEMETEEDVRKALEKHRQYLGQRYIEVFEVTNNDAETILKKATQAPADDGVVRLRGLPFSSTEDDIVNFFSGLDIAKNGITIVRDTIGRNSGEAFVQFSSQEEADKALQKDRHLIGPRYIEVFPSRSDEIRSSWRRRTSSSSQTSFQSANMRPHRTQNYPRTVSPQNLDVPMHYIHLRGLPFQASGEDIVKFFFPLTVSKILIECGPDGRLNGEADVYFRCHRDAIDAMSRDRMKIGHRYIELFLNSPPDCN